MLKVLKFYIFLLNNSVKCWLVARDARCKLIVLIKCIQYTRLDYQTHFVPANDQIGLNSLGFLSLNQMF